LGYADVSAARSIVGAIKTHAVRICALFGLIDPCTLRALGHWILVTDHHVIAAERDRVAAFAAGGGARVPATRAACSAWKLVAFVIFATDTAWSGATISATSVALSAQKFIAMSVATLDRHGQQWNRAGARWIVLALITWRHFCFLGQWELVATLANGATFTVSWCAGVAAAFVVLRACKSISVSVFATDIALRNADVPTARSIMGAIKLHAVWIHALLWLIGLCTLCTFCHGILVVAVAAAAFATGGCTRIPTARAACSAWELVALVIFATDAAWSGAAISAARIPRSAQEFVAIGVPTMDRSGLQWLGKSRSGDIVLAIIPVRHRSFFGQWEFVAVHADWATLTVSGCAGVATAFVVLGASKRILVRVFATDIAIRNANVPAARRIMGAVKFHAVWIQALLWLIGLLCTFCALCHGIPVVAFATFAAFAAAFAAWGCTRIPAARAACSAWKLVAFVIFATHTAWSSAAIPAARIPCRAQEFVAMGVHTMHRSGLHSLMKLTTVFESMALQHHDPIRRAVLIHCTSAASIPTRSANVFLATRLNSQCRKDECGCKTHDDNTKSAERQGVSTSAERIKVQDWTW
jgi:hypothetical protein